jgi:hypothetical protein
MHVRLDLALYESPNLLVRQLSMIRPFRMGFRIDIPALTVWGTVFRGHWIILVEPDVTAHTVTAPADSIMYLIDPDEQQP